MFTYPLASRLKLPTSARLRGEFADLSEEEQIGGPWASGVFWHPRELSQGQPRRPFPPAGPLPMVAAGGCWSLGLDVDFCRPLSRRLRSEFCKTALAQFVRFPEACLANFEFSREVHLNGHHGECMLYL